jgi:DNA repair protein RadA/Sms
VIGEVGLGGEVRPVRGIERRLTELARLGFTRAIVPAGTGATLDREAPTSPPEGLELIEAPDLAHAARAALEGAAGSHAKSGVNRDIG